MIARIRRNLSTPEAAPLSWGFATGLLTLIVALIAFIGGAVIALSVFEGQPYASLLGWILGGIITLIYVIQAFRSSRDALHIGPTRTRLFLVLLFSIGVALLIDTVVLALTGVSLPAPELFPLATPGAGIVTWLAAAAFLLIVQPISEELVFRGVFFPSARQIAGGWGGWLLCSLAYAVFHLLVYSTSPTGNIWQTFITPLLIGLVLTAVRADTRSTRAAMVAHMGFSLFALLKLLVLAV